MTEVRMTSCPRCKEPMRLLEDSERTVASGTWYELRCPRCGLRMDGFKPRRKNSNR